MRFGSQCRALTIPGLTLALVFVCADPVGAQETRLRDGRVLIGHTARLGDQVRIDTLDGRVTVPAADIERTRSRAHLGAELRSLAKRRRGTGSFAQLELAKLARRHGLLGAMWRHLDASLADGTARAATRDRIQALLGSLEPELLPPDQRALRVDKKVRRLLKLARGKRNSKVVAIESVLAGLEGAGPALRKHARRAGSPFRRLTAVRALSCRAEPGDDRFVLLTAILDSNDDVREGVAQTATASADPAHAVQYLSPGLLSQSPKVAKRTAEAFANIGDISAVPLLVHAGPIVAAAPPGSLGGRATRGYIAVIKQENYIRDFDVEVAQAAFIADPKIDVLQSGTVFDAAVLAVVTERLNLIQSYRKALRLLTGSDPGKDPLFWAGWLAQRFPDGVGTTRPGELGSTQTNNN